MRINRISSRGQPTRGGPPAWGLGEALTTPPREKQNFSEIPMGEMLPLETKQSGGKILPHSDLPGGGSVSRGGITQQNLKWILQNKYGGRG